MNQKIANDTTQMAKYYRFYRFIEILKKRPTTIESLAATLEVSKRTVYRYLNLLEALEFKVKRNWLWGSLS